MPWFLSLLFLAAQGVLTVQSQLGVSHPTIAGTIASAIVGLVGAKAVHAAHQNGNGTAGGGA